MPLGVIHHEEHLTAGAVGDFERGDDLVLQLNTMLNHENGINERRANLHHEHRTIPVPLVILAVFEL